MKRFIILLFALMVSFVSYSQTVDSVRTTDTPNQGRIKINTNDQRLRDSIVSARSQIVVLQGDLSNLTNATAIYLLLMRQTDTTMMLDIDTLEIDMANKYTKNEDIRMKQITFPAEDERLLRFVIYDTAVNDSIVISMDYSGNMTFKDNITGTKTLAQLAANDTSGGGGIDSIYWTGSGPPDNALGDNGGYYWDSLNMYSYHKAGSIWRQDP